jgi:Xaa-Pro aminopeptidase
MKHSISFSLMQILFFFSLFTSQLLSGIPISNYGIYEPDGIKAEEYRQRRVGVLAKMDLNSVAIFRAQDYLDHSGPVHCRFRQNSDFFYLTGCQETNSTLVLIPGGVVLDSGRTMKEILFITAKAKEWTGENLGIEGAREVLGFGTDRTQSIALTNDRMNEILSSLLSNKHILYYTPSLPETLIDPVSDISFISWRESMKNLQEKYLNLEVKGVNLLLGDMRSMKSHSEIELLQKAADITTAGQIEVMKSCEPGMYEYQLQAVAEYCFTRSGAENYAFPSIIGSGPNTQFQHYGTNRRKMQSGDLVVIDIGAEYHGYTSDITRTIPVNGKFSTAQKDVYDLVLQAQTMVIESLMPGMLIADIEKKGSDVMSEGLIRMGIAKDFEDAKKYCLHKIIHFIGLDVHDVAASGKLMAGMVLAVEPGIYIPEGSQCNRKYWNIGIRIEDDVVVTDDGRSVLSAFAPQSITDIELLMKKRGIGNLEIGKE